MSRAWHEMTDAERAAVMADASATYKRSLTWREWCPKHKAFDYCWKLRSRTVGEVEALTNRLVAVTTNPDARDDDPVYVSGKTAKRILSFLFKVGEGE